MSLDEDVPDEFYFPYWRQWQYVEMLSIRTAACLLTNADPARYHYNNRTLPSDTEAMAVALEQAVILGKIDSHSLRTWDENGNLGPTELSIIGPHGRISHDSMIKTTELAQWCEAKSITHRWPLPSEVAKDLENKASLEEYPSELRAAIEVFQAIKNDPLATARQSPKAAITAWLEKNRPELSINARDRVATVANWQPSGGAPRTPLQ